MKKGFRAAAAALVLTCAFLIPANAAFAAANEPEPNILSVSGTYTVTDVADEAYVTIGVKTSNIDYKLCQTENKTKMNAVTAAIRALGIEERFIKTEGYTSTPIYEYIKTEEYTGVFYNGTYYNKRVLKEYQLTHTIRVMLTDVSLVGRLVDITVENGVNEMNNISFALSKPKQHTLYLQALEGASNRAKEKADVLAKSFGIKTLKVKTINTDSYTPYVNYASNAYAPSGGGGGGAFSDSASESTSISSGELQITATVNIVYNY